MHDLWPHQEQARLEALQQPKRLLAWDPRLGKTQGAIECIKAWGTFKGVVVAPLVVCPQWEQILTENGICCYNAYKGASEALGRDIRHQADTVVIVNYDKLYSLIDCLLKWKPQFVIFDESHWIKSPSAKRARAARRLGWNTKYCRLLTGTPVNNHLGDLWGQMTIVDPESWDKSFGRFASKYLIRHPLYSSTIIGYIDQPGIERMLIANAHIVRREDVFGSDQYQYVRRGLSLPSSVGMLYKRLAKEWVLDSPALSAEHIFKRLVRLQQLTSGYLPLDDGTIQEIHTTKIDAVMADLDEIFESGHKVVLFHQFRWEGDRYEKEITKRYPGVGVGRICGGDRSEDREAAIRLIEDGVGANVVIAQTRAGGIGISLRKAKYIGFLSSGYSHTERRQAIDRVFAPGQGRCVTDYIFDGTIDCTIERVVTKKGSLMEAVRNLDKQSLVFGA